MVTNYRGRDPNQVIDFNIEKIQNKAIQIINFKVRTMR